LQSENIEIDMNFFNNNDCFQETAQIANCLKIFWIDAYEASGKVYIFGKIFDGRVNRVNEFKSCCVCVNNVTRNLYVLPRSRKYDEKGNDTDTEVTMEGVHKEIESICLKHKIMSFTSKIVSRKYAFELPGIPSDSDYLKLKYSFSDPTLPNNLSEPLLVMFLVQILQHWSCFL